MKEVYVRVISFADLPMSSGQGQWTLRIPEKTPPQAQRIYGFALH